jgi:hypothetical protein
MLPSTEQARADQMFSGLIVKGLSEDDIYAWWESGTAIAGGRTSRMLWSDGQFESVGRPRLECRRLDRPYRATANRRRICPLPCVRSPAALSRGLDQPSTHPGSPSSDPAIRSVHWSNVCRPAGSPRHHTLGIRRRLSPSPHEALFLVSRTSLRIRVFRGWE